MDGRTASSIKLRKVLSDLYPDETSAKRVMYDAGLNSGRINFSTGAVNFWHDILIEANRNNKLSDLMLVARNDYGSNKELQQILVAYRIPRKGESELNVASEELYPSRRGCYLRMGQVSASVVITLFLIVLLANFQVIIQTLSKLMYPNLTPVPTVEIIPTTIPLLTETPLPELTSIPQPTVTTTHTLWNCEENIYNCSDFASHDEAQKIFDQCMTLVGFDVHKLDPDKDSIVCESISSMVEPTVIASVVLSQTLSETSTLVPLSQMSQEAVATQQIAKPVSRQKIRECTVVGELIKFRANPGFDYKAIDTLERDERIKPIAIYFGSRGHIWVQAINAKDIVGWFPASFTEEPFISCPIDVYLLPEYNLILPPMPAQNLPSEKE